MNYNELRKKARAAGMTNISKKTAQEMKDFISIKSTTNEKSKKEKKVVEIKDLETDKIVRKKVIESSIPESAKIWLLHLTGMSNNEIDKKLNCKRAEWIITHYQKTPSKAGLALKRYVRITNK